MPALPPSPDLTSNATPDLTLDFTDSELASALLEADGTLRLLFSAAQVVQRSDGERGHVRHLVLACRSAHGPASEAAAFGTLLAGTVHLAGQARPSALGVPGRLNGPLTLTLQFAQGAEWRIAASALEAAFTGPPDFRPSFAC